MSSKTLTGVTVVFGKQRRLDQLQKAALRQAATTGLDLLVADFNCTRRNQSDVIAAQVARIRAAVEHGNHAIVLKNFGKVVAESALLHDDELDAVEYVIDYLWDRNGETFVVFLEEQSEDTARIRSAIRRVLPSDALTGEVRGRKITTETGTIKVIKVQPGSQR